MASYWFIVKTALSLYSLCHGKLKATKSTEKKTNSEKFTHKIYKFFDHGENQIYCLMYNLFIGFLVITNLV